MKQPQNSIKHDPLFDLIKSMTKAQKRNFKLYANRSGATADAKFIALFDAMDSIAEYDQEQILTRCRIQRPQLANAKSHLYRQILVSIRLLESQHTSTMVIREMIDFARILYDKALFRQSMRQLEKAKALALDTESFFLALEIVEFEKRIETLNMSSNAADMVQKLGAEADLLTSRIHNINLLSGLSIRLYSLNLQLGYMRSQKDETLIQGYFCQKLMAFDETQLSFHERLYLYQGRMWYSYIQHDFLRCYRYASKWVTLFDDNSAMKTIFYDHYIRATSRLLDVMFMTRQLKGIIRRIKIIENEIGVEIPDGSNARVMLSVSLLFAKINVHFMEGSFSEGVKLTSQVEDLIDTWGDYLDEHYRMMLYYKIGCMYFGNADYDRSIYYLQKIIQVRQPSFRRDLQVFARMLNLIASYERGDDYSLDYQVRSVYSFIVKMNDMHAVQHELITFLRRLPRTYQSNFRGELQRLYDRLKPLESHPYERRPFFYLDIISWLESKITGRSIAEIIQTKFETHR